MKRFNFINLLLVGAMLAQSSAVFAARYKHSNGQWYSHPEAKAGERKQPETAKNSSATETPKTAASEVKKDEATKGFFAKAQDKLVAAKNSVVSACKTGATATANFCKNHWGKLAIGAGALTAGVAGLAVLKNRYIDVDEEEESSVMPYVGGAAGLAGLAAIGYWFYKKYKNVTDKDASFWGKTKAAGKDMWSDVIALPGKAKDQTASALNWTKGKFSSFINLFSKKQEEKKQETELTAPSFTEEDWNKHAQEYKHNTSQEDLAELFATAVPAE